MQQGLQSWIAVIGGLLTAALGIFRYFNYRTHQDRATLVGQAFASTIDGLSSDAQPKQLAAAILLRRFFDPQTEQGAGGVPYGREATGIIAALLRKSPSGELQKLLADGLAYAPTLRGADLQGCNLTQAYLGRRARANVPLSSMRLLGAARILPLQRRGGDDLTTSAIDLSDADLFGADLTNASLRGALARKTVFYTAVASGAVFEDAHLEGADFRQSKLSGARFRGAWLEGARFADAKDIPSEIARLLDQHYTVPSGVAMPLAPESK